MGWRERFWSKVEIGESCWLWLGARKPNGYGQFGVNDESWPAHRLAYADHYGEVPDDRVLDHTCNNRACVRPSHLEPVTIRENNGRAAERRRVERLRVACLDETLLPFAAYVWRSRIRPTPKQRRKRTRSVRVAGSGLPRFRPVRVSKVGP